MHGIGVRRDGDGKEEKERRGKVVRDVGRAREDGTGGAGSGREGKGGRLNRRREGPHVPGHGLYPGGKGGGRGGGRSNAEGRRRAEAPADPVIPTLSHHFLPVGTDILTPPGSSPSSSSWCGIWRLGASAGGREGRAEEVGEEEGAAAAEGTWVPF